MQTVRRVSGNEETEELKKLEGCPVFFQGVLDVEGTSTDETFNLRAFG